MNDETLLRAQARKALQAGKLPARQPDCMWGGPGSGDDCAICGERLAPEQMGFDLEFADGDGRVNHVTHLPCFAAWELERQHWGGRPQRLHVKHDGGTIAERQAIETAFFAECSYAQVAAQLNEPLGTIKTRIRSALTKLRQALTTEEP